jgi:hypothetical protein
MALQKLFPKYKQYERLIKEMTDFKSSFTRNEKLLRNTNGDWLYSKELCKENYDTKVGELLLVEMTFPKLDLKPEIKKLTKLKRKTYKIEYIPPPPPPLPM